jgi:hypothetical protein
MACEVYILKKLPKIWKFGKNGKALTYLNYYKFKILETEE